MSNQSFDFSIEPSGFQISISVNEGKLIVCLKPPKIKDINYECKYGITDLTIEAIYKQLEDKQQNSFNNQKIIDLEKKDDWSIYKVKLPLIIASNHKEENRSAPIIDRKTFIYPMKFFEDKKFKTRFEQSVTFEDCDFKERVMFQDAVFEKTLTLDQGSKFLNGIDFKNCEFQELLCERVIFGSSFESEKYFLSSQSTSFKGSSFLNRVKFSNSQFFSNIYFNNCTFNDFSDFHECVFEKNVSFYNVEFKKFSNFSQAIFKDSLNMVNAKMFFNFPEVKEFIEKIEDQTNQKQDKNTKPLENFANDFRDSFRIFKNTLSKEGNILDASNYHRAELYCKEIELDSKPQKTWQDRIDSLQLWFYRLTSEHHTDLAKIFNNVILLIALFGMFSFGINKYKETHLNYEKQYFGRAMASAIDLSIRKKSHSLTKSTQETKEAYIPPKEALSILALCLSFAGIFIGLIALKDTKCKIILWCINILSYVGFLGILIYKPSLLLPFVGQLFDEGIKANFPAMQSLSVVYCILMFLMLFSLQKTARKNSIIPS